MSSLVDTLDAVRKRELAQRLDQGEQAVLAKVADQLPQPPAFDEQTRADLQPFISWTTQKSVRYAPCKPAIVSAFLLDQVASGASTSIILRRVSAISVLHDHYNLADPTNTTCVREVLNDVVAIDPPRSWTKEEKAEFATFPIPAQKAISRREQDRERALRQRQNELAEERKRLKADADKSAEQPNKETTMAKWNGPQGSKDMEKDPLTRDESARKYPEPKSILNRVEKASQVDDGFAGKLPKSE